MKRAPLDGGWIPVENACTRIWNELGTFTTVTAQDDGWHAGLVRSTGPIPLIGVQPGGGAGSPMMTERGRSGKVKLPQSVVAFGPAGQRTVCVTPSTMTSSRVGQANVMPMNGTWR